MRCLKNIRTGNVLQLIYETTKIGMDAQLSSYAKVTMTVGLQGA